MQNQKAYMLYKELGYQEEFQYDNMNGHEC